MRFRRPALIAALCCLLLGGCADSADQAVEGYVVRPQDTLYSIAWRHDLDFRDLARWNNIGSDFRISVGQVLRLGPGAAGTSARASGTLRLPAAPAAANAPNPVARAAPNPPLKTPSASPMESGKREGSAQRWVWPADRASVLVTASGAGILLSGKLGQEVRAACAGRVVYMGSGLRGYGNLIIIKHGDSLLSAYAHNRAMMVHEGQDVAAGQAIARMGEGAHQAAALYFEIRQNGRPVNPLLYFPTVR